MRFQFCFTGKKRLGTIQIAQSHPSKVYKRVQGNLGFNDSNLSLNTFLWAFETRTSFVFLSEIESHYVASLGCLELSMLASNSYRNLPASTSQARIKGKSHHVWLKSWILRK